MRVPISEEDARFISQAAARKAMKSIPESMKTHIRRIEAVWSEGNIGLKIIQAEPRETGTKNIVFRGLSGVSYMTNGAPSRQVAARTSDGSLAPLQDVNLTGTNSFLTRALREAAQEWRDSLSVEEARDWLSNSEAGQAFTDVMNGIAK